MTRTAVVVLLAVLSACAAFAAETSRPPNFVIILADDLGLGDIGPYGATRIATPHTDRMAEEGAILTNFYSGANVCTPSRGALLTGKYPIRLGLTRGVARPSNEIGLSQDETTIATMLREAGYATACIGKWHLGHRPEHWPTAHGFDYFYGLPYSNDMLPLALYRMDEAIEEPVNQRTLTERYTQEGVRFIEEHAAEPFFLYLAHTMPHVPLHVSEKFEGRSEAGLYGDVVEAIDWSVGQIMSTLERLGIEENTLVLFTSDNGPWWEGSSGGYRNRKGSAWDGGMHVPLIAWWPGTIAAGTSSGAISMNFDFFPTLRKLAGVSPSKNSELDGRDIFPLLMGSEESPHEYLYLFDGRSIAAVRTQQWKLVVQSWYRNWNTKIGSRNYYYHPGLLFDMEEHPDELYSQTREHPEVARKLSEWIEQGRAKFSEH
ncbi:MAG: sulfatase [Candidatus Hydrogenedentes bacterium]|nr:sulfatase [Candidatus Hydrogenedentota bacterium]